MASELTAQVMTRDPRNSGRAGQGSWRPRISVGVVNNMPDMALQTTERQFLTHLEAGAGDFDLRVHLFSLPGIARSGAARDRVKAKYLDYGCLHELHMDALVVTGAVPVASSLSDEPFWPHMVELADWARTHTLSVLWSCLAAHAVVLHMDQIERSRLPRKLSGLYPVETERDEPLLTGSDRTIWIPHSRYNGLPEASLRGAGYTILSRSDEAGVDMFYKATPSLFLCLQGHPEYDGDTLMREYRRDVSQYLAKERDDYPGMPANYFDLATEAALTAFSHKAHAQRHPELAEQFPDLRSAIPHLGIWHPAATQIFRNWINHVAALKAQRRAAA
jgi:homoserine O-succinyltransferase/O-acetyltransferase